MISSDIFNSPEMFSRRITSACLEKQLLIEVLALCTICDVIYEKVPQVRNLIFELMRLLLINEGFAYSLLKRTFHSIEN